MYTQQDAARSRSSASAETRRRAISRVTTMRWRGVSVRSREGQRGSQKPHSVQRSASFAKWWHHIQ
jgi:hypothetical protein